MTLTKTAQIVYGLLWGTMLLCGALGFMAPERALAVAGVLAAAAAGAVATRETLFTGKNVATGMHLLGGLLAGDLYFAGVFSITEGWGSAILCLAIGAVLGLFLYAAEIPTRQSDILEEERYPLLPTLGRTFLTLLVPPVALVIYRRHR